MIDARDITFCVGNKELLSDISVSFVSGKLHLMIGPNGAGKSTLIKVLSGFIKPQRGTISYEGKDIRGASEAMLARRRAVLSQAVEVAFPLTVREVVMMGRYPHFGGRPGPADERIVDEMTAFFDVTEFSSRNYQTLSGGERQRVNFARVLAQLQLADPEENIGCRYLFLDEPLTFLDIRHQIEFMKKVREFADAPDVVVVGVVHDLNLAARFADEIVMIDGGRVVTNGPPLDVLTVDRIRKVFQVETTVTTVDGSGINLVFD